MASQIDLLSKIADAGEPVSAKDVGVTAARMRQLEGEGLLARPKGDAGIRKTGGKGRPAHLYKLTSKATKRVKRHREQPQKKDNSAAAKKAASTAESVAAAA